MIMHPEILEKAQAEIDSVIGSDRLPDFDDRKSLPYLGCIVKELHR
jgi:Cytochrome P450